MRIMFCSSGGAGHVLPMLQLALTGRRCGHDIAWAAPSDAMTTLVDRGFDLFEAGASAAVCRIAYRERWPEYATLRGSELGDHMFSKQFGGVVAPAMIDGLTQAVESWKPDLVVNELGAVAAPLVCRIASVPHATHAFGLMMPRKRLDLAAREFAPWWREAGLEVPAGCGLFEHLYIDIAPPTLQTTDGRALAPVQLAMPNLAQPASLEHLPAEVAQILKRSPSRPVIYLTFGTVYNRSPLLPVIVDGLARLDSTVIATVGNDGDTQPLQRLPSNVHAFRYIPQNLLLPHCSVVVSHGGAGTMLAAFSYGLPQLVLPQGADQFRNADACTTVGAGISLTLGAVDADAIEHAASSLLGLGSYRQSAQQIANEIRSMPSPEEVIARLETLT
jgi:UDP:flavonoid glycosyltransferase YjiC (YdhE family)